MIDLLKVKNRLEAAGARNFDVGCLIVFAEVLDDLGQQLRDQGRGHPVDARVGKTMCDSAEQLRALVEHGELRA